MCGFAGVFKKNGEVSGNPLSLMKPFLQGRGPDSEGIYREKKFHGLHQRLKILDLTSHSNQPMISNCSRYVLFYNGQIYNYKKIKQKLISLGHTFNSLGDTEVVLTALIEYGTKALSKFDGMYSIALFDRHKQNVLLTRDRLGIKPLYFFDNEDMLIFSSEIKPILALKPDLEINENALIEVLKYRYRYAQTDLIKGVQSITPGTYKVFTKQSCQEGVYWDLKNAFNCKNSKPLHEVILESINDRLKADTPIATLLSSGLDSTGITYFASRELHNLKAFCYDQGGPESEIREARSYAKEWGIDFEAIEFDEVTNYEKIIYHLEEPIADSIILPTWLLAERVKKDYKVILSGEGADEVFSGYVHHFVINILDSLFKLFGKHLYRWLIGLFEFLPSKLINFVLPYPEDLSANEIKNVFIKLKNFTGDLNDLHFMFQLFTDEELEFYVKSYSSTNVKWGKSNCPSFPSLVDDVVYHDLKNWNERYSLLRLDRIFMAHGVEVRVPYLSHHVVETALSTEKSIRLSLLERKSLLRKTFKKLGLPKKVVKTRKTPFISPLRGGVKNYYEKQFQIYLQKSRLEQTGFWNVPAVTNLLERERSFIEDKKLVAILHVQVWLELFKTRRMDRLHEVQRRC